MDRIECYTTPHLSEMCWYRETSHMFSLLSRCFCPKFDTKASDTTFKRKPDPLFLKTASLVSVSALKQTQMFELRHLEDKSRTVPPEYLSQVTMAMQHRG